jgi:cation:H+ antiporter
MNFEELSPWLNAMIFVASAIAVWIAGTKLAGYADAIAGATGIGHAMLGLLLLGGITSLPEIAVATTATLQGTPALSINDVLGSACVNIIVLAVADAISGRRALTSVQGSPLLMLQGVLCILLLAFAAAPVLTGDRLVLGIGIWSWVMLAAYIMGVRLLAYSNADHAWRAGSGARPEKVEQEQADPQSSLRTLVMKTIGVAAVILVAGFFLARTGEGLAQQTGLGTSFFGAVFLALATSLPEWSTVIAATRLGRYEMAISDIFGTNLFNVTIVVLVDALHPRGPVMLEAGPFAAFGALLALAMTAIYLVGMLERRDRTLLRMGWDSIAVLVAYVCGVVVLHGLR